MAKASFKRKNVRTIYDQNYYKAQAMIADPWFIEQAEWLKKRFEEVGCPLPDPPFTKYQEYMDWNDKFWKRFAEMERSPEFLAEKQKITGGKEMIPADEFYALEDFKDRFLPPVYGEYFREILKHFKINPQDKGFRDFLERYFFFGSKEYYTSPITVVWKRNEKTDKMELFIRIFGHTKKEDIVKNWSFVAEDQKHIKDFIGKNKEWETFDRDLEIYNFYKSIKDPQIKRNRKYNAIDYQVREHFSKKWPKLTITHIRTIVAKTRKRLGEI